jgi:hypothetical protein
VDYLLPPLPVLHKWRRYPDISSVSPPWIWPAPVIIYSRLHDTHSKTRVAVKVEELESAGDEAFSFSSHILEDNAAYDHDCLHRRRIFLQIRWLQQRHWRQVWFGLGKPTDSIDFEANRLNSYLWLIYYLEELSTRDKDRHRQQHTLPPPCLRVVSCAIGGTYEQFSSCRRLTLTFMLSRDHLPYRIAKYYIKKLVRMKKPNFACIPITNNPDIAMASRLLFFLSNLLKFLPCITGH